MGKIRDGSAAKIHDLLCQQRQLLMQYLLITREQEKIIAAEDVEALRQNLERRQQIISRSDESLGELIPLWQAYDGSHRPEPSLNALYEEIGGILREATAIEQRNNSAVHEQMEHLCGQIRLSGETRRGAQTYIKGAETFSAGYVDELH